MNKEICVNDFRSIGGAFKCTPRTKNSERMNKTKKEKMKAHMHHYIRSMQLRCLREIQFGLNSFGRLNISSTGKQTNCIEQCADLPIRPQVIGVQYLM